MEIDFDNLEQLLEHRFSDRRLASQALTHPSFQHEQSGAGEGDYQRLEFLGDSVLGMVLAETLYLRLPDRSEGDLSRSRSRMADQDSLASVARGAGVGMFIRLGRGEEQTAGRDKDSILADVLEALIGAVYLDGGLEAARRLVLRLFGDQLEKPGDALKINDAKSELQEVLSARQLPAPCYRLVGESGPPHCRQFRFQVWLGESVAGEGSGRSKKAAQQAAAVQALEKLLTPDNGQA
ncbi:ribonuclease 3 [Geobacter sp. SVR]|nr:ribonuclease 3 [Geobacter sp. SVR]GCF85686.1 ribonuclease 3 [Geobacter sp. SVR]